MMKKTIVVMGLGIFGSSVAKTLSKYDCDVIAIDKNIDNVERVSAFVDQAIQADFTNYENLKEADLKSCDIAVIGTSRDLESAILAVLNCKKLGIPTVVAKAKNKVYMEILYRVGADKVIRPEKDTGERLAQELAVPSILDYIKLDERYSIYELVAPDYWVGKSLSQLDLRNRFDINLIGFRTKSGNFEVKYNADMIINKGDVLVFIGNRDSVDRIVSQK